MREEEELIEQARHSREETEALREESEGRSGEEGSANEKREKPREGEPWAKTSSGDAEHITDDD